MMKLASDLKKKRSFQVTAKNGARQKNKSSDTYEYFQ